MKKQLQLIAIQLLTALLLIGFMSANSFTSAAAHVAKASELSAAAEMWQQQLAKQQGFEHWEKATLSITALGPGTHGWLVLVKNNNEVVGYMIIYAKEAGGYILSEYGSGDAASLQFLADHVASFSYFGPFHSIVQAEKKTTTCFIEPFMQEAFPITAQHIEQQQKLAEQAKAGHGTFKLPALITGSYTLSYFDPYETMPWLTREPLNKAFEDDTSVEMLIELDSHLQYTTESWNHAIFSVYSVTGFHEWNEIDLFLALQDSNESLTRYIAYDTLMEQGLFYSAMDF